MNTTIQALQALYVKLGGSLTDTYETIANGVPVSDYTTIPDMIEACTQKAGSGGSALPAVTAEDNGSVLTVVEGAWDKATGSGVFYAEYSTTDGTTWTTETDFNDIIAAYESGKTVKARAEMQGTTMIAELTVVSTASVSFCHSDCDNSGVTVIKFSHAADNTVSIISRTAT